SWPRQAVLVRAAHREVQRLLEDWLAIDPQAVEPAAAARVGELWAAHAMDPDELTGRLRRELEQHAGPAPEALFEAEAAAHDAPPPLAPDPDRLWQSLQRLQGLVGLPDAIETPPAPAPGAAPPAGG